MRDHRRFKGFPWLICDLQPLGKRLVRGPREFPRKWFIFCPKRKFPRDRVLISECEGCSHFHGYRLSFSDKVAKSLDEFGTPTQAFRVRMAKPKHRRDEARTISEEELKLAVEKKKRENEEWEEEERKIKEYYKKENDFQNHARDETHNEKGI